MKKLLVVLGLLIVFAGVGAFLLVGNLGGIIKGIVEEVGTQATQTPVTLAQVDISLTDGSGELKGLVVANPESFETEHAMSFGTIRVQIDTSTLNSDPVVIEEVVIDAPQIIYEVSGGGTNIGVIQENVEAFAASLGGGGDEPAGEPSAGESRKVVIENLYVRNANASVSASFLGGEKVGVTVPEIHLQNLGQDEGGATAGEVAAKVLDAIADGVIEAVTDQNITGMSDALKKQGEGLLDKAGDALGGLFGGDDDEKKKKKRKKK